MRLGRAGPPRPEVAAPLPRAACIQVVTARRRPCRSDLNGLEAALTTRPGATLLTSPMGGGGQAEKGDTGVTPGERNILAFHLPPHRKRGQALEVSRASAGGRRVRSSPSVCPVPGLFAGSWACIVPSLPPQVTLLESGQAG